MNEIYEGLILKMVSRKLLGFASCLGSKRLLVWKRCSIKTQWSEQCTVGVDVDLFDFWISYGYKTLISRFLMVIKL